MPSPRTLLGAILLAGTPLTFGGCSVTAASETCFSVRPNVVRPDPAKVYANLSSGQSGKELAEAIFGGDVDNAAKLIDADPRLLQSTVLYDKRMDAPPNGQYGDMLAFAASRCDIGMVKLLLDKGMPADGAEKGIALQLALLSDGPEVAELLLRSGANPDPQKIGGARVMRELIAFDAVGGVQTLLRHGADLNDTDEFGNTPLQVSIDMEQYVIAELFAKAGASLWAVQGAGILPAAQLMQPSVMELSGDQAAAKQRLVNLAKASGLPWPPPDAKTVRKMVFDNKVPRGIAVSDIAKKDIAARFANER